MWDHVRVIVVEPKVAIVDSQRWVAQPVDGHACMHREFIEQQTTTCWKCNRGGQDSCGRALSAGGTVSQFSHDIPERTRTLFASETPTRACMIAAPHTSGTVVVPDNSFT